LLMAQNCKAINGCSYENGIHGYENGSFLI